jgi:hypothetical protein
MNLRLFVVGLALSAVSCAKSSSPPQGDAGPAATSAPAAPSGAFAASATSGTLAAAPTPGALVAARLHPCALLTQGDVEVALGAKDFTSDEHGASEPTGSAGCSWRLPQGRGFAEIQLKPFAAAADFEHLAALMKQTPVQGVGEKAYAQPNLRWGHVDVLKDGQVFMVQVSRGNIGTGLTDSVSAMQAQAVTLAGKVAGKM